MMDKNKPKELDWGEKTYKFIKNILLDAEEKKVPHPVLISQIFSLLTQQRTELLEEIDKEVIGKNTDCYWSTHTPEERDAINERLDYQRKKLKSLLNKKDE